MNEKVHRINVYHQYKSIHFLILKEIMSILQDLSFDEVMEQFDCHKILYDKSRLMKNILIWEVFSRKKTNLEIYRYFYI